MNQLESETRLLLNKEETRPKYATKHAEKRIKERVGGNKKSVDRIAEIALYNGMTHAETSGSLKRWCNNVYLSHRRGNNMRLYGEKCYVFQGKRLITVLSIPNNLKSHVKTIKK